jgi:hypothetical protein
MGRMTYVIFEHPAGFKKSIFEVTYLEGKFQFEFNPKQNS